MYENNFSDFSVRDKSSLIHFVWHVNVTQGLDTLASTVGMLCYFQ